MTSTNINTAPVEQNWMIHIPSACYIYKSKIILAEEMADEDSIACFHLILNCECLVWVICKLELSLLASYIRHTMHYKLICTCHLGIPPCWV